MHWEVVEAEVHPKEEQLAAAITEQGFGTALAFNVSYTFIEAVLKLDTNWLLVDVNELIELSIIACISTSLGKYDCSISI